MAISLDLIPIEEPLDLQPLDQLDPVSLSSEKSQPSGSFVENAIGNAAKNGINIDGASMMITFRPCYSCAKQIVNQGIKNVYYLFDYDREDNVREYFRRLGVKLEKYSSNNFKKWIAAKQ